MTQDWPTWLDRLELSIRRQRAAVAEGRHDDVVAAAAAPELGPLPAALASRARDLLQANASLTAELKTACTAQVRQLKLLSAMQPREAGASYLDTRS